MSFKMSLCDFLFKKKKNKKTHTKKEQIGQNSGPAGNYDHMDCTFVKLQGPQEKKQ